MERHLLNHFLDAQKQPQHSSYVYINPDTFENTIFILFSFYFHKTLSVHTSIFQKFLIHTEMSENIKIQINAHT